MALSKLKGIVLTTHRFAESSVILKCYTDQQGLQSYIINHLHHKKSGIKPSYLQPLSLLELEAYQHQNRSIKRIKEVRCTPVLKQVYTEMVKTATAVFMAEVLLKSIHEENHPEPKLFSFIEESILALEETTENLANFPLAFLLKLSDELGYSIAALPSDEIYTSQSLEELMALPLIFQHRVRIPSTDRKMMLDHAIQHFQRNSSHFGQLKALSVLTSVFH